LEQLKKFATQKYRGIVLAQCTDLMHFVEHYSLPASSFNAKFQLVKRKQTLER